MAGGNGKGVLRVRTKWEEEVKAEKLAQKAKDFQTKSMLACM